MIIKTEDGRRRVSFDKFTRADLTCLRDMHNLSLQRHRRVSQRLQIPKCDRPIRFISIYSASVKSTTLLTGGTYLNANKARSRRK